MLDNNTCGRSISPIAVGRKNSFFAGHDEGGRT
ncbi:transposase [uncultured Marivita sp.]|nr:transposase [Marivita sp. XM-24bin2]MCR9110850.1 IS66 family transposase [Paracoccaceae bacterium]